MGTTGIVNVTNLSKRYGNFIAVNGISFSIRKGEIFGFLGPNGAGKTTTINMMIGLARPSGGSIEIDGIDAVKNVKKAQSIMGIVSDESNLYDEMDGFENLCFCGSLYGMRREEREQRAKELLAQFDLAKAGKRPFKAYSKGMRRKLTIAAGIIHRPEILFLDEPTTGIDVESARQIRHLLLELKQGGTTIFITTHYIEDAERICDRIAFIVGGSIVANGTVSELMKSVSHGYAIRLTADQNLEPFTEDMQQHFEGCTVKVNENHEVTMVSEERISLSPVLQYLDRKGISVFEAKEIRPSLEDVFVKITGIEAEKLKKEKEKGGMAK
ncbi:MAG: ABC transporter ATP-binding protein [Clostridiales bacterium]|jgi:ABC-2 type transport system ATP-binding protein|nr:ABC transporter ATP-binding protein [Clostridiales bacterium]